MLNREVHFLVRWFAILTLAGLAGCGSVTHSKNGDLQVQLEIPEGEDPADFWLGVSQKSLHIQHGSGDPQVVSWKEGQSSGVEIRDGDQVSFEGLRADGTLLVTGEATAGGEKSLTIPLRRVP